MSCQNCVHTVENVLKNTEGIQSFNINLGKEQVVIESNLPSSKLIGIIEATGKKAVLVGYGSTGSHNLGAAVAMVEAGNKLIRGVIRLVQSDENKCVIEGTVDGLSPGLHAVCVHELGDLTNDCISCGDIYLGINGMDDTNEPYGQIGDVEAGENGRAVFRVEKNNFKVWDVIGRSMVIHQGNVETLKCKNKPNERLACGIIARSAGLFENSKKICACDGVTLWDERDVPLAGTRRQTKLS